MGRGGAFLNNLAGERMLLFLRLCFGLWWRMRDNRLNFFLEKFAGVAMTILVCLEGINWKKHVFYLS